MNIEIEIVTGDASWPRVKPLFDLAWPRAELEKTPWAHIAFGKPDLRVIVEADEQPICHVGLYRREGVWKDRKTRIGGIGGVTTHPDFRRQGFASVALNAAIHTLKEERATDFALLFADPQAVPFYTSRAWKPFIGEVYAEQAGERARFDVMTPLVFYLKRAPHEGELDLCGLPW